MGWEKPVKSARRTDRACKNGRQRTGSDALSRDASEAAEKHRSRTLSPGKVLTALRLLTAREYGAAKSYHIIYP